MYNCVEFVRRACLRGAKGHRRPHICTTTLLLTAGTHTLQRVCAWAQHDGASDHVFVRLEPDG